MNVFEHAMQMELDGKKYYEECAEKVEMPQLKQILMELASDEVKHYEMFKAMRDNVTSEYDSAGVSDTFQNAKNIFSTLGKEAGKLTFSDDTIKIWEHACKVEKEAADFYKAKASEEDDPKKAKLLLLIAEEEDNHWKAIDNILNFLKRPAQWVEDAEWRNPEDF